MGFLPLYRMHEKPAWRCGVAQAVASITPDGTNACRPRSKRHRSCRLSLIQTHVYVPPYTADRHAWSTRRGWRGSSHSARSPDQSAVDAAIKSSLLSRISPSCREGSFRAPSPGRRQRPPASPARARRSPGRDRILQYPSRCRTGSNRARDAGRSSVFPVDETRRRKLAGKVGGRRRRP